MSLDMVIGTSDFREVREGRFYYVDKSHLIGELLAVKNKVVLLPRPRRFGKTLNLAMLHCFFDQNQRSLPLFEGLSISQNPSAMAQLNAFPTIFLTFSGMDFLDWESCQAGLKDRIGTLVANFLVPLQAVADPYQREVITDLHFRRANATNTASALSLVIELLAKATGKKVFVLIDEYDKLILDGKARGYFPEITSFIRNFLGSALKDNPHLERAVITGILRISKESIYSGLNNLAVYSLRDPEFSTCFGFTEAEVHKLLCDTDLLDKEAGVKAWYNGYSFGKNTTIYNPWSIMRYVSRATKLLCAYWINTSDNQLIRELIQNQEVMSLDELEVLLSGGTVRKELMDDIAFAEMNPETAWSLMFFTGYLTARNMDPGGPADLAIPNLEVKQFFSQTVTSWLGGETAARKLAEHLLAEDFQGFAASLAEAVSTILSCYDTGGKRPERTYHVFMLGLLAQLQSRYLVESERPTGHGRADLCLIPRKPGNTGFIFEFKAGQNQKTLETDAKNALAQIQERDYLASQRQQGVKRFVAIGLAFHGKRIALASQTYEAHHAPTETETFSAGLKQKDPAPSRLTRKSIPTPSVYPTPESDPAEASKVTSAMEIQRLQQAQGLPITPFEFLVTQSQLLLKTMLESLKLGP